MISRTLSTRLKACSPQEPPSGASAHEFTVISVKGLLDRNPRSLTLASNLGSQLHRCLYRGLPSGHLHYYLPHFRPPLPPGTTPTPVSSSRLSQYTMTDPTTAHPASTAILKPSNVLSLERATSTTANARAPLGLEATTAPNRYAAPLLRVRTGRCGKAMTANVQTAGVVSTAMSAKRTRLAML